MNVEELLKLKREITELEFKKHSLYDQARNEDHRHKKRRAYDNGQGQADLSFSRG